MADYTQEQRDALAQEYGYDTYYEYRQAYGETRDHLEGIGIEADRGQILDELEFRDSFDAADSGYTRDELREWFDEHYPDGSDQDFYDWLGDLYDQTAG